MDWVVQILYSLTEISIKQNNIGSIWIGLKERYQTGFNMPSYDFKNKKTGEVKEYFMSYKDLDQFKKDNPDLEQQISAPNFSYKGNALKSAGDGWK